MNNQSLFLTLIASNLETNKVFIASLLPEEGHTCSKHCQVHAERRKNWEHDNSLQSRADMTSPPAGAWTAVMCPYWCSVSETHIVSPGSSKQGVYAASVLGEPLPYSDETGSLKQPYFIPLNSWIGMPPWLPLGAQSFLGSEGFLRAEPMKQNRLVWSARALFPRSPGDIKAKPKKRHP